PRAMLALITLAALPVPNAVRFYPDNNILSLNLDCVADGQAWSRHLGGKTDSYLNTDGRAYLDEGVITWHGWSVHQQARAAAAADVAFDADATARLTEVGGSAA